MKAEQTPAPIFILSPMARSGTNFLWDLLRRHPGCTPPRSPVWEDYLLKSAGPLDRFATDAQRSWDPSWGPTAHLRPELLRHLGDALVRFLSADGGRRLVTKSPTIANLDLFYDLFPSASLLLLIRDGRDTVASGMKTFGWSLESGARTWAWGVDTIHDFVRRHVADGVLVVRFEDLVHDLPGAFRDLLEAVGLDPGEYDPELLVDVPVRGSSALSAGAGSGVSWEPVPVPDEFNPVGRWREWSQDDVARFEAIAGPQLQLAGYEPATEATLSEEAPAALLAGPGREHRMSGSVHREGTTRLRRERPVS